MAGVQLAARARQLLWFVGLATAGLTAFYMWRLMNMTFYGKSRVAPEVAAHIHESPRVHDRAADAAGRRQRAGRLAGHAQAVELCGESFRGFERWLEPVFASAAAEAAEEGEHARVHGMDADGPLGGRRDHRHLRSRATSISTSPRFPMRIEARCKPLHTAALQQVVRGRDLRFPVRQRPVQGRRPALGAFDRNVVDGGVNGAGWLTRFSSQRLHLVGHLDRRWRGALHCVLREDAFLPGVHPADRPRAGLRASSWWWGCWRSSGIT